MRRQDQILQANFDINKVFSGQTSTLNSHFTIETENIETFEDH